MTRPSQLRKFGRVSIARPSQAAAIAWWYLTRRKMRARERLKWAAAALPLAYRYWIADGAQADSIALAQAPDDLRDRGTIALHIHWSADTDPRAFAATLAAVQRQSWPRWIVYLTHSGGALPSLPDDDRITVVDQRLATRAQGLCATIAQTALDHIVPLRVSHTLPRHALRAYAASLSQWRTAGPTIVYGDQEEISSTRSMPPPWLKPDWDPDLILAQDYVSAGCLLPVSVARTAIDLTSGHDHVDAYALLLSMTRRLDCNVRHINRVVVSTPRDAWQAPDPARIPQVRAVIAGDCPEHSNVEFRSGPLGTTEVIWPLPQSLPLVSIIVPTRDNVDLLRTCMMGILGNTSYPFIEVVIVDNGSVERETLAYLSEVVNDSRVQVISWPGTYNYSAINNFAVGFAVGEYICLLNNDIEIIDPDWLTTMVRQAIRPENGAVGARLLYPDRSIQHAGVVIGLGNAAGHAHRGQPDGQAGYFANALVARRACAVTAACLVVARRKFEAVGGLDAENLAIAYNDVDLCLKLREAGWHNIYVPQAVLIHHESKSRGSDFAKEHQSRYRRELAILQDRWRTRDFLDPAHHLYLDRSSETYRPLFT